MADEVKVTVTADTRPYESAMGRAAQATGRVDKAQASMAASLAKTAAAAAAAGVTLSTFTRLAQDSIHAAGELQDSTSKMQVVFGSASSAIRRFANDSTQSFGLSKRAAYDATSTFAVFGKAAGLTGDALTKFSTDLTKRAVDLSSFYGGSVQDAITAVGAALRGESEPIRAYGVLLDDATLRAQALKMGLVDSVKEGLTPQTRALAAANEVMRQSADASGDYLRTIDGYTNSAKEAQKAWEDAKASFGTAILPIATQATKSGAGFLQDFTTGFQSIPILFDRLGALATGNSAAFADAERRLSDLVNGTDSLGTASDRAAAKLAYLGDSARWAAGSAGDAAAQVAAAIQTMNSAIDSAQAAAQGRRDLAGIQGALLDSARQPGGGGGVSYSGARSKADAKAHQEAVAALRKKDAAEEESEIKAARRAAQRKAERRADAQARRDVQKGVAGAIATDKAARAGQDIDGFDQTGSVGEATGSLTKGEQAALNKKIEAIRARHQKALAAQIKGMEGSTKAAHDAARSADDYSFSLDKNTEAGRRNAEAISGQVDKAQAAAKAAYDDAVAQGKSAQDATKVYRDTLLDWYQAIVDGAGRAGYARDEVKALLDELQFNPKTITITFKIKVDDSELTKAEKRAAKLRFGKWNQPDDTPPPTKSKPKKPTIADQRRPRWDSRNGGYTMFASGGEVHGPAGPDRVPAWLTHGEYVVTDRAYQANRDLVRAINAGNGARVGSGALVGSITVHAADPMRAGQNVIDAVAEAAYRHGAVR